MDAGWTKLVFSSKTFQRNFLRSWGLPGFGSVYVENGMDTETDPDSAKSLDPHKKLRKIVSVQALCL